MARKTKSKKRKSSKPKRDIYAEVTNTMVTALEETLAAIEAGDAPEWTCPWAKTGLGLPRNAATKRRYNGVNVFLLSLSAMRGGYVKNDWMTYKQAAGITARDENGEIVRDEDGKAQKCHVRKGEKGTLVTFWRPMEITEKKDGVIVRKADGSPKKKKVLLLKHFVVFNVAQIDGLPSRMTETPKLPGGFDADAELERWLADTGATIHEAGQRARYDRLVDRIEMPTRERFDDAGAYYATATHELGHWTGHESRLDRQFGKRFGDEAYAIEELVAEMASAFACAHLGIEGRLQHAEYLAHWIRILKADTRAIFTASSAARKAFEYLERAVAETRGETAECDQASDADLAAVTEPTAAAA